MWNVYGEIFADKGDFLLSKRHFRNTIEKPCLTFKRRMSDFTFLSIQR